MIKFTKTTTALALVFSAGIALATPPKQLVTHNETDVESNAYVAGTIPSQHPTKAHSEGRVMWAAVKMACFGHIIEGKCWAVIKMQTDTQNPVDIGRLTIDMETGAINPLQISGNGYTMTVIGPGESIITKNN